MSASTRLSVLILIAVGAFTSAYAQQSTPPAKPKTAADAFKNIQVLKDVPENRFFATMSFFADSLGVSCEHCHERPFDADIKPAKAKARKMIQMVNDLNEKYLAGSPGITCNSCHRGNTAPLNTPGADFEHWVRATLSEEKLPDAADLIKKFQSATGLEGDLSSHSQVITAQVITYGGDPRDSHKHGPETVNEEVTIGGKDRSRMSVTGNGGKTTFVHSGQKFQASDDKGPRDMTKQEQRNLANELNVFDLDLIGSPKDAKTLRKERVYGHQAYVVEGVIEGTKVWLFFDDTSGYLLRVRQFFPTFYANASVDVEFDDYKKLANVTVPFTVRVINPGGSGAVVREMKSRKLDEKLDAALFDKP